MMDLHEMEEKIDELVDELECNKELLKRVKEAIQEKYDIASYNDDDEVMTVLRALMYIIEGDEVELID